MIVDVQNIIMVLYNSTLTIYYLIWYINPLMFDVMDDKSEGVAKGVYQV